MTEEEDFETRVPKSGWDAKKPVTAFDASIGVQNKKVSHWDAVTEELIIPDLDVEAEEEIIKQVSAPPMVIAHKVEDIKALNKHMGESVPHQLEGGIDLSLLTGVIREQSLLVEKDLLWDYKSLQTEIAQAYHERFEEYHEKEEDDEKTINKMPTILND